MTGYYSQTDTMLVAVDCIIFGLHDGKLSLLLTKRKFEPEAGQWSLMGGFVGRDESLDHAAQRVLIDLTGLTGVFMEQVGAFGAVDRDPGERVVSVAYYALINVDEMNLRAVEEHQATWVSLEALPLLCFDHHDMIEKALEALRNRFVTTPVAFKLLPKLFTLSQMQGLYETILDENLDKRNFRKRIGEISAIVPTDLIDKTGSRRGARLYRFDKAVFDGKFKL